MPDREKVKKGVWQCWLPSTEEEYETQCHDCPYYEPGITLKECMTALRTDTLALLKEQEAEIERLKAPTANEMNELIDEMIAEKSNCAIASEKHMLLSIVLDWAIEKRKELFLKDIGIEPD